NVRVLLALAVLMGTAFIAGIYPALVLSSQKPIGGLKGRYAKSRKGILIRKSLVVVQIAISTTAIIALLVINAQIGFLQNRPLGFEPQDLVYIDIRDASMFSRYQALANELEEIPEISSFTSSSFLPGGLLGKLAYASQEGPQSSTEILLSYALIDPTFIQTMGMDLVAGENF